MTKNVQKATAMIIHDDVTVPLSHAIQGLDISLPHPDGQPSATHAPYQLTAEKITEPSQQLIASLASSLTDARGRIASDKMNGISVTLSQRDEGNFEVSSMAVQEGTPAVSALKAANVKVNEGQIDLAQFSQERSLV